MACATLWNQCRHSYIWNNCSPNASQQQNNFPNIFNGRQLVSKQKEEKLREEKNLLVGRRREKEKRGGLLSGGHFGCHLSPWRRGPGPQKPLGRTDCLSAARYFLQHHLSLSPHNDSPRSSLLMFVIALSHKGGWSMEPRGAPRGQEMSDCCLSV